jgi:hypothetical protein
MPSHTSSPHSGRVAATATIWGCSLGMLSVSLLLSADAQSGTMIAIALICATAISTMTVWLSAGKISLLESAAAEPVQDLQERMIHLESAQSQPLLSPQSDPSYPPILKPHE